MAAAQSAEERAIWRWLLDHAQAYPAVKFQPPLRPPKRGDKPRRFAVLLCDVEREHETAEPVLRAVEFATKVETRRIDAVAGDGDLKVFEQTVLAPALNRAMTVVPFGGSEGLHLLLRRYGRHLLEQGYTIQPLGTGNIIKALIIRRERLAWTLVDHAAMTGLGALGEAGFLNAFAGGWWRYMKRAERWWWALDNLQTKLIAQFRTNLQVTIGRTALRAATRHLSPEGWLWRTPPLAVAMARAGGGYRGGYAVATRFVGDAWRADLNKAYTWGLSQPLPRRMALVRAQGPLWTRDGLYLCRVSGRPRLPVYLGVWRGPVLGFERIYHEGGDVWTIIPLAEAHGLNRLGLRVEPVAGYAFTQSFDLGGYVEQLQTILDAHPRGSPEAALAKVMGVNVYGKFAESPDRMDVMYAAARPDATWHPYTDNEGEEHPDLWTRRTVAHRGHQRIDIAAQITGRVRALLYTGLADALDLGATIVHADTDGFLTNRDPAAFMRSDPTRIGAWRVDAEPRRAFVWGRKAYAYGDDVRVAGGWGVSAAEAARLAQGGELAIEQTRMAVPWRGTAIMEPLTRTLRATV